MVRDKQHLEEFNKNYYSSQKSDLLKNLSILEGMWEEAKELGIFPLKDPLDGIEKNIRIARILNRNS